MRYDRRSKTFAIALAMVAGSAQHSLGVLIETDSVSPLASDPLATDASYQTQFDGFISETDLVNVGSPVLASFVTLGTNSNALFNNTPNPAGGWAGIHDGLASTKPFQVDQNNLTNDTFLYSGLDYSPQKPTATFTFTVPHDITGIRMVEGWGDSPSLSNQVWKVYINGSATELASVNYQPHNGVTEQTLNGQPQSSNGGTPNSTMVLLSDSLGGFIATNVTSISIVWDLNNHFGQVVRELDVTGTPSVVPEPASLALLAMGGLMVLRRRGRD